MDSKTYKQNLLDALYAPYKNCTMCPLGFLGRKNVVFGEGNPDADLMLIGEGPGAEEDAQGRPFVGRSGKLLTKILDLVGLPRPEVFITNIVKCRPPNNRKPLPFESTTCKGLFLKNQIRIIRPSVICTLGATAIEGLLDLKEARITKTRGIPTKYEGITVIPAYHPAYILRNPKELTTLVQDITLAKSLITPKKIEQNPSNH